MLQQDMIAVLKYLYDKGSTNELNGSLGSRTLSDLNISAARFQYAKEALLKEELIGFNHPLLLITPFGILKIKD
jgi:hypothetical protein